MSIKSKTKNSIEIDRRDFIRISTIGCCLACMPFATDILFAEEKKCSKKKSTEPTPFETAGGISGFIRNAEDQSPIDSSAVTVTCS